MCLYLYSICFTSPPSSRRQRTRFNRPTSGLKLPHSRGRWRTYPDQRLEMSRAACLLRHSLSSWRCDRNIPRIQLTCPWSPLFRLHYITGRESRCLLNTKHLTNIAAEVDTVRNTDTLLDSDSGPASDRHSLQTKIAKEHSIAHLYSCFYFVFIFISCCGKWNFSVVGLIKYNLISFVNTKLI